MRDKVADPEFLQRKKIEKELGKRYPDKFVSVYEMVSFTRTPYKTALECIQEQDTLLKGILDEGNYFEKEKDESYNKKIEGLVKDYHSRIQKLEKI